MTHRGSALRAVGSVMLAGALLASGHDAHAQGALSALQTDVNAVTQKARASVVTVFAQRTVSSLGARDGKTRSRLHTRVGSGVAVEENVILTTASVVLGAERLQVRTANGLQVDASLVGLDPVFNLALLRVPEIRLPPIAFAAGRPPQVGDWIIALGTSYRAQPTQSVGYVAVRYDEPRIPLLQLTNTVYPGNSGGAALNPRGELVGIVQGELAAPDASASGAGGERRPGGMSFVLPVETVRPVYQGLRREGRVRHGYLGVTTTAASVTSDTELGLEVPIGARIESVAAGSPAAGLGLKPGDLVVGFDRERVEYPTQLARWVAATSPGSEVEFVWVRDEVQHVGRIALSESRQTQPSWAAEAAPESPGPDADRIAEIERQVERLNRELKVLRNKSGAPARP
ncbi:MAG TPA: S1C family serine protease [Candidatus Eisenbacteria bacterium]